MAQKPWRRAGYLEQLPITRPENPPIDPDPDLFQLVESERRHPSLESEPDETLAAAVMAAIVVALALALVFFSIVKAVPGGSH